MKNQQQKLGEAFKQKIKQTKEKQILALKKDPDYAHLDMYQLERVIIIQGKSDEEKSIAELFEMCHYLPKNNNFEMIIESKIRETMMDLINKQSHRMSVQDKRIESYEAKLINLATEIKNLQHTTKDVPKNNKRLYQLEQLSSKNEQIFSQGMSRIHDISEKTKAFREQDEVRFFDIEQQAKELYTFAHRDLFIDERIQEGDDALRKVVIQEIERVEIKVMEKLFDQDIEVVEANTRSDRIDRMFQSMKVDIRRHETMCYEIACKFESQHDMLLQLCEANEVLKSYALQTDLHLEAYQPLQVATIAYEVGKHIVQKNKLEKYKQGFAQVLQDLEKNALKVCDPNTYESVYKKLQYTVPSDILASHSGQVNQEILEDDQWQNMLDKVSLADIKYFHENETQGKQVLFMSSLTNQRKNDLAEMILRQSNFTDKFLKLTNEKDKLTEEALNIPIQQKFIEQFQKNEIKLRAPLNLENLKPFHDQCMSQLKTFLNMTQVNGKVIGDQLHTVAVETSGKPRDLNEDRKLKIDQMMQKEYHNDEESSSSFESENDKKEAQNDDEDDRLDDALYSKATRKKAKQVEEDPFFKEHRDNVKVMDYEERNKQILVLHQATQDKLAMQEENMKLQADAMMKRLESELAKQESNLHTVLLAQFGSFKTRLDEQIRQFQDIANVAESAVTRMTQLEIDMEMQNQQIAKHQANQNKNRRTETSSEQSYSESSMSEQSSDDSIKLTESIKSSISNSLIESPIIRKKSNLKKQNSKFSMQSMLPSAKKRGKSEKNSAKLTSRNSGEIPISRKSGDIPMSKVSGEVPSSKNSGKLSKKGINMKSEREIEVVRRRPSTKLSQVVVHDPNDNQKTRVIQVEELVPPPEKEEKQEVEMKPLTEITDEENEEAIIKPVKKRSRKIKPIKKDTNVMVQDLISKTFNRAKVKNIVRKVSNKVLLRDQVIAQKRTQLNQIKDHHSNVLRMFKQETNMTSQIENVDAIRQNKSTAVIQPIEVPQQTFNQELMPQNKAQNVQEHQNMPLQKNLSSPLQAQNPAQSSMIMFQSQHMTQSNTSVAPSGHQNQYQQQQFQAQMHGQPQLMPQNPLFMKGLPQASPPRKKAKIKNKVQNNDSSSESESEEVASDSSRVRIPKRYRQHITEFEKFKKDMEADVAVRNALMDEMQAEQAAFQQANIDMINKFDAVDWNSVQKSQDVADEFREIMAEFQNDLGGKFKNWRTQNQELSAKFEHIQVWVPVFTEMLQKIKDEMRSEQKANQEILQKIINYINLQIVKDDQDLLDRENIGLCGVKERESTEIIQLDPRCFNSYKTNGPDKEKILELFKIACLRYKPSDIQIPGSEETIEPRQVNQKQREIYRQLIDQNFPRTDAQLRLDMHMRELQDLCSNVNSDRINYPTKKFKRPKSPRFIQNNVTQVFQNIMSPKTTVDRIPSPFSSSSGSSSKQPFQINSPIEISGKKSKAFTAQTSPATSQAQFSKRSTNKLQQAREIDKNVRKVSPDKKKLLSPDEHKIQISPMFGQKQQFFSRCQVNSNSPSPYSSEVETEQDNVIGSKMKQNDTTAVLEQRRKSNALLVSATDLDQIKNAARRRRVGTRNSTRPNMGFFSQTNLDGILQTQNLFASDQGKQNEFVLDSAKTSFDATRMIKSSSKNVTKASQYAHQKAKKVNQNRCGTTVNSPRNQDKNRRKPVNKAQSTCFIGHQSVISSKNESKKTPVNLQLQGENINQKIAFNISDELLKPVTKESDLNKMSKSEILQMFKRFKSPNQGQK